MTSVARKRSINPYPRSLYSHIGETWISRILVITWSWFRYFRSTWNFASILGAKVLDCLPICKRQGSFQLAISLPRDLVRSYQIILISQWIEAPVCGANIKRAPLVFDDTRSLPLHAMQANHSIIIQNSTISNTARWLITRSDFDSPCYIYREPYWSVFTANLETKRMCISTNVNIKMTAKLVR